MRLSSNLKTKDRTPPIFADLVVDIHGMVVKVNVEEPGWLAEWQEILPNADRVGLVPRGMNQPAVWLTVDGTSPRYLSRVIGKIDDEGHRRVRVAGLQGGEVNVWLHHDGLVEVGPEPTWRE